MFGGDEHDEVPLQTFFPVHLTGSVQTGGIWFYDWTEQTFNPSTGAFADGDSPRTGTKTAGPFMVEINNQQISTPTFTWARMRGMVAGEMYFEFLGPTSSGSSQTFPTNPTNYTFVGASFVWGWTYTTSLTISLTGGPLIFTGQPIEFNAVVYYVEAQVSFGVDQNNYALGSTVANLNVLVTVGGGVKLTGMSTAAPASGFSRIVWITNDYASSGNLTLTHLDAGSLAANQFTLPNSVSYVLKPGDAVGVYYSGVDLFWACIDNSPSAAPTAAQVIAVGGEVWQQYKIKVNAGTAKWDVTNPDGTVTSTALAAATTQTLNLNASEPAGTTVVAAQFNIPTAFTGVTAPQGQMGYSGGDTSGGASASALNTYSGNASFSLAATNTRVATHTAKDFTSPNDACPNTTTTWTLTATITSSVGNLTLLTAGEFHVWFLLGTAAAP